VSSPGDIRQPPRRLTPDEFRHVIGHFASGVTVVTTTLEGKPYGTTASAVTSLSLEPPMVLIAMSQSSATGAAIAQRAWFAINILGESHGDIAVTFARRGGDKFADTECTEGHCIGPLLAGALGHVECRVKEQVTAGTHIVFIAEAVVASARPGAPLAYFRGRFGRLEFA
jgi:flavin reductase (DIM6/NTAB) family NADH-FMN oxidoreductase RutF